MSCAWAAHLRSTRADILLDPRRTSRALRRIGSHSFCLAQFHSTIILLGRVLAHSGAVRSFTVPSLARSASAASPLFFSSFLPYYFIFHVYQLCRFRRVRARASFSSSRSPRPTAVSARCRLRGSPCQIQSGAWRRTNSAENGTVLPLPLALPLAPGTTRVEDARLAFMPRELFQRALPASHSQCNPHGRLRVASSNTTVLSVTKQSQSTITNRVQ